MPRKRGPTQRLESQLAYIARRIRHRRHQLGISQDELADRLTDELRKMGVVDTVVDRSRIAKIELAGARHLQHRKSETNLRAGQPKRSSSASLLEWWEIQGFARALAISEEWLRPSDTLSGSAVYWDPCTDPNYARGFLNWLEEHGQHARELVGWGEFLPCSLESEAFMRAHHHVIFSETGAHDGGALMHEDMFNQIGNQRRKHLLDAGAERSWSFVHLMYRSDLQRIADGQEEYAQIDPALRRECIRNLMNLVSDESTRVRVLVAEDADIPRELWRKLRDSDSLAMFDEAFVWWRDHNGTVAWSADRTVISHKHRILEEVQRRARYTTTADIIQLLQDISGGH